MNQLSDPQYIKNLFKQYHLRPKDYMGQNFLIDEEVLQQIVEAAELKNTDTVLEVGPGLGTLTIELAKRVGKVVAVEKDERLFQILEKLLNSNIEYRSTKQIQMFKTFENSKRLDIVSNFGFRASNFKNAKLINQDILKFHIDNYIQGPYKVVANIPYYLTSKLFQYFLEQTNKPQILVLMVQKEVGERIVAHPGELSILGISIQIFADAEIVRSVSKKSFWPEPEVDSAILKIIPKEKYPEITDKKLFFRIVKIAFSGKRKQIHNTLASGLKLPKEKIFEILNKVGISSLARPQELSLEQWTKLYLLIKDLKI